MNIFTTSIEHINIVDILITFWAPIILNLPLVFMFNKRTGSHGYSKDFSVSLPLFSALASVLTFIIGESIARAFGLVGTISLIRFRTPIKSILDATYLFTSLAIGICCGTGQIMIGIVISLSAVFFFAINNMLNSMKDDSLKAILNVSFTSGEENVQLIKDSLASYCKVIDQSSLSINSKENESSYLINLKFKKDFNLKDLYNSLDNISEIKSYHLMNNETALFF